MGGAAGMLAGLLYSKVATRGAAFEIEPASIGALAGLVSITAACANIGIWEGALAGFVGGLLACWSREGFEFLQVDDPVGAIPVHFVGGVWGLIVVGLWHRADGFGPATLPGLFFGGDGRLLGIQLLGTVVIIAWGVAGTMLFAAIYTCFQPLRVSAEDEKRGLDVAEHGIVNTPRVEPRRAGPVRKLLRTGIKAAARATGSKRRQRHNSPSPRGDGPAVEEFVEDVGHAANVSALARRFGHRLRQRALAKRQGADDAGVGAVSASQVELERGSSNELGVCMASPG